MKFTTVAWGVALLSASAISAAPSKTPSASAAANATLAENIHYAELADLMADYGVTPEDVYSAVGKRSAEPWNWRVFCHLPGQGCRKVRRDAEAVADATEDKVEFLGMDDLVEGDATHDVLKRSAEPWNWRVFCHLPGQGCKKIKREVEALNQL